jgi:hypothetical protein
MTKLQLYAYLNSYRTIVDVQYMLPSRYIHFGGLRPSVCSALCNTSAQSVLAQIVPLIQLAIGLQNAQ